MGREDYVQCLNRRLREIGAKAQMAEEASSADGGDAGLSEQISFILQEAEDTGVFLPFAQVCETIGLTEYEKILACLLWNCHSIYQNGLMLQKTAVLLKPYETEENQGNLASCFWAGDGIVRLSPVLMAYLEGQLPEFSAGMRLIWPEESLIYDHKRLLGPGEALLKEVGQTGFSEALALVLSGEPGSGRDYTAQQLAARFGAPLLCIQGCREGYTNRHLNEMVLCVSLYGAFVYADMTKFPDTDLLKELSQFFSFLLLKKDSSQNFDGDFGYVQVNQEIEKPDARVKRLIVEDILKESGGNQGVFAGAGREAVISRQFPMASFLRYVKSIKAELLAGIFDREKSLYRQEYLQLKLLPAHRTFEELKLQKAQYDQLVAVCDIISARKRVLSEWGFETKFSYGNGISILLYGAPGTGKTMTAQVMANRLEMPLFRVDLSQLMSKYIGETQKNIGKIFDEADRCDGILLFDEADAIFARRSEVSDAQDKYSNAETAYLLQRIEQYSGVSILATNLFQNFDEAFCRRITYMVHFPMPDVKLRKELWKTIFPREAPVSKEIDYDALAIAFELSGAAIKNAAIHGAYRAMAGGRDIRMQDLLDGIHNEYVKQGKTLNEAQKEMFLAYQE